MKRLPIINRARLVLPGLALALAGLVQPTAHANNLIGHWINGSQSLTDSSGFTPAGTHDGVAEGPNASLLAWNASVPAGCPGKSLDLSATNVAVAITNTALADANYQPTFDTGISNQLTVAYWLRFPPTAPLTATDDFVTKSGFTPRGWRCYWSGGQIGFTIRNGPNTGSDPSALLLNTTTATNGNWHHVVMVFDGTANTPAPDRWIYVDGVLLGTTKNQPWSITPTNISHLMLGCSEDNSGTFQTTRQFPGLLYDVRMYNYPLDATEVSSLYTNLAPSTSPLKEIKTLSFGPLGAAAISGTNITITVPYSTNVTALAPTLTLSAGATCSPLSGAVGNFTTPQTYTVTAQDGSTQKYLVTVTKATPSSACNMLSFTWGSYSGLILGTNVSLAVPAGTVVTGLAPTCTVSGGANVSPPSGSTHDFTSPVSYTVTAENGTSTQTYVVQVLQESAWTNTAGGNWSALSGANWNPNGVPTSSSATALAFNVPGTYTSTDDLADGFQLNQLMLGAPALTLAGGGLQFTGTAAQIAQNGSSGVVISNNLDLAVNTALVGTGFGAVTLAGAISDAGSLTKNFGGILTLSSGANTYFGGTIINAGVVNLGTTENTLLGTGPVTVNGGATLNLNGNGNLANSFTLNGVTVANGNSFSAILNGPVNLQATSTFDLFTTGNMSIGGDITGPGGLTKNGAGFGPLNLSGANTFTGNLTINAGTVAVTGSGYLGGGSYAGNILNNGAFIYNSSAAQTLSGAISGTGTLKASGPGTLTLSGTNSYTGVTTVTNGVLELAAPGSLYNGNTASWTAANILVASNATLMVDAGGVSGFSGAQIGTLLANLHTANSGGLQAGSAFGFGGANTATVSATIANSTGTAGGPIGLTKAGTGTVTLSGINTYTGPTRVQAGVLALTASSALGGGAVDITSGAILQMNYPGTRQISKLTFDGVVQPAGVYGATGSGATTIDDIHFAGFGTVTVLPPPAPVLDPSTGFLVPVGGNPQFTFTAVVGAWYRLVSSPNVAAPLSAWQGVVQTSPHATDANGWLYCDGVTVPTTITFVDPTPTTVNPQLFYRLETAWSPTP